MRRSGMFSVTGKMRRSYRDLFLMLAACLFVVFLFTMYASKQPRIEEEKRPSIDTKNPCLCESKKSGDLHNFCYIDPQNVSSVGLKFSCDSLKHLEELGILNFSQHFVDISIPTRDPKDVVFLSACSDDHFTAALQSLNSVRKFYPNQKFILYSLGLSSANRAKIQQYGNVELRDFDFKRFPRYTSMLMQYRWKPLIIAEVLKEFENIWWMDAHIKTVGGNFTEIIYQERADNNVTSDIIFFVHSSHSNYAVLLPKLLEYIPSNSEQLLKSEQFGAQLGANIFYVSRTRQTLNAFKWWILCALDETCMNPPTAQVYCRFGANRYDYFANCFRFDQSVINLLLLNHFQDYHKYTGSVGYKFDR